MRIMSKMGSCDKKNFCHQKDWSIYYLRCPSPVCRRTSNFYLEVVPGRCDCGHCGLGTGCCSVTNNSCHRSSQDATVAVRWLIVNKEIIEILCLVSEALRGIIQSSYILMYILFLEFGCTSRFSEEQQQLSGGIAALTSWPRTKNSFSEAFVLFTL